MAYNGYFLKIGSCTFQNPPIKREGFVETPRIVQVTETKTLASGKLSLKELEHKPSILSITFPIMTIAQAKAYANVFRGGLTSEDEMYLTVEWYDIENDTYTTGTFYHTDLVYTPVIYNGEWMAQVNTLTLHEY